MPLYINSTKVGSNAYDVHSAVSTKLNKIKMGNTDVWQGLPPYYNELKNGTVLTESQWLEFLNNGGIAAVIQNNDQTNFINKQVKINNNQASNNENWIIGDFNHDNTNDTCDLTPNKAITSMSFGSNVSYADSTIRAWLNGTYLNGFSSNVRNKLVTMLVSSEGNSLSDKVKIFSATEVGGNASTNMEIEGIRYPIFTLDSSSAPYDANSTRIRNYSSNSPIIWWLRTVYTGMTFRDWAVESNGALNYRHIDQTRYIVPCIRFS